MIKSPRNQIPKTQIGYQECQEESYPTSGFVNRTWKPKRQVEYCYWESTAPFIFWRTKSEKRKREFESREKNVAARKDLWGMWEGEE